MDLRDILVATKSDITIGKWSDEKLRSKDFPLTYRKGGAYPLSRRYRWQTITFTAQGKSFRILNAYSTQLPEYVAVFAEDVGNDSKVLMRWEFHQSHDGWHAHPLCEDISKIKPGIMRHPEEIRLPQAQKNHRRKLFLNKGFAMDDNIASIIACERFKIPYTLDIIAMGALPWN